MNKRTQSKITFYTQLLYKLHIINEQEKGMILKQVEKKKAL
jgi:hypothetical protein